MKVKYIKDLKKIDQLPTSEVQALEEVAKEYPFRSNTYYNSLIDWDDPDDPLRHLVVPNTDELKRWGQLDASEEELYQHVPGIEHKYKNTVLLLCNDVCAAYCRFCFRKRLFQPDNDEVVRDVSQGVAYIKQHPEVDNVLLTGGDPLIMSTSRLENIIEQLLDIEHVRNIRIGTKIPAFNPYRVTQDGELLKALEKYGKKKQIYVMGHFNHPRELTEEALMCLKMFREVGAAVVLQTPIIRKINDHPEVLGSLFEQLSFHGFQPYYVFACRPTAGNSSLAVPIEEAFEIYREAVKNVSGLAKTARFIMSHKVGKLEIVGLSEKHIFFRNHNLVDSEKNGEISLYQRNADAYWLEDYADRKIS